MKNSIFLAVLSSACAIFSSCATAIKTPSVELTRIENEVDSQPTMDFIGFKIDPNTLSSISNDNDTLSEFAQAKAIKNTKSLRNLGHNLESAKIAQDKSSAYFGIYSLQEMELYKSAHRYATFVEVAQNKFIWDDNATSKKVLGGIGGGLLGEGIICTLCGAFFKNTHFDENAYENAKKLNDTYNSLGNVYLGIGISSDILGIIGLIAASTPTKTDFIFNGTYNIYIYDTKTKEIIRKEPVSVEIFDTLEGSYDYDNESKNAVNEYISAKIHNALLTKYQEINRWLKNRE